MSNMPSRTGHASAELPDIDERLVAPGSGYEIADGKLVRVSPSDPPHAIRHSKVSALLEAHAAPDFEVASDMLTRTSETSDRAPDASVFPRAPDPETGRRQLDHLSFEIVSTETLAHAGSKAADLATRGVRRVFAIDVERHRAFEWSPDLGTWRLLDPTASIDDPSLAVPLPIDALVGAAAADDAVARALLAKQNRVLVAAIAAGEARGEARGEAKGMGLAVLQILAARGLVPSPAERERIERERDRSTIERWLARATTCATVADLLVD